MTRITHPGVKSRRAKTQHARDLQQSRVTPEPRLGYRAPLPKRSKYGFPKRSKYGFDRVGESGGRRRIPVFGPGTREVPMTLPRLNLPPVYEEDDE